MPALRPHSPVIVNADLHSHSYFSDGTLSPADLAHRAHGNGVELWSLTDHDEIAGQKEAAEAAGDLGLPYVTGAEISVSFAGQTVHIVGLDFDPENSALQQGLNAVRNGRSERARAMSQEIEKATGLQGVFDGALALAANPQAITRAHLARFLVQQGLFSSVQDVFRKYLAEGKPGFVPHYWISLQEALQWIRCAGGVAVIAHPARYRFTTTQEFALFSEFKRHGGQAVEVITGSHTPAESLKYAGLAKEFGLLASRGSDFHSPQESRVDLGALPSLPQNVEPVWNTFSILA